MKYYQMFYYALNFRKQFCTHYNIKSSQQLDLGVTEIELNS